MKEVLPLSNGKALQITETALSDEEGDVSFCEDDGYSYVR